ncbi:MAG: cyclic nucleotide-binding domain-containing protein [Anaerolineae bacterium]|nr:cyclic nucleotide-binding domain-containing protein [Anaerolineae bacterium]
MMVSGWSEYTSRRSYQIGEYISHQGDPGIEMYIVEKGSVAIIREEAGKPPFPLSSHSAGAMIGEIGLLQHAPRSASIIATEPTDILVLSRDDFWYLFRSDYGFQETVLNTIIDRLLSADVSRVEASLSEHRLYERLGALSEENRALAELMQLRQETIHFIVHDLRNPLNMIMMALSILEMPGSDVNERASFMDMAKGGVQRMLVLIDSLLDVERLESGDAQLEMAPLKPTALLTSMVESLRPLARSREVRLETVIAENLPTIIADAQRLERVLANLIDNAVKFTPRDGLVTVSSQADTDGNLVVAVNDTGPGIPPEQREHLFERFAQTETGRKGKGFGLGLAFSRIVIEGHRGTIRA